MPEAGESKAVRYLLSLQPGAVKLGLERMRALCACLGNPERGSRYIHVAGTNGKGSSCAMLASVLTAAGFRTGLFTSPHLVEFRERIRIDGEMIAEQDLEAQVERVRHEIAGLEKAGLPITFFEGVTGLALDYFQRQKCDAVVLETGLGGRLDSTNVVRPEVCAVTRIGLDHQQYLGKTLAAIAGEKAGIFKPEVPVVTVEQEPEAMAVLRARADGLDCPLRIAGKSDPAHYGLPLAGDFQRENLGLVLEVLDLLRGQGWGISGAQIKQGIRNVRWPGRFQILRESPPWILDGAHNAPGLEAALSSWRERYGRAPGNIVFGCMKDKDHGVLLQMLRNSRSPFRLVPVPSPRSLRPEDVPGAEWTTLRQAWEKERSKETAGGALFCGSLYLVGEVLALERGVGAQMAVNG